MHIVFDGLMKHLCCFMNEIHRLSYMPRKLLSEYIEKIKRHAVDSELRKSCFGLFDINDGNADLTKRKLPSLSKMPISHVPCTSTET